MTGSWHGLWMGEQWSSTAGWFARSSTCIITSTCLCIRCLCSSPTSLTAVHSWVTHTADSWPQVPQMILFVMMWCYIYRDGIFNPGGTPEQLIMTLTLALASNVVSLALALALKVQSWPWLGGQVLGLRGKTLGFDLFGLMCLLLD